MAMLKASGPAAERLVNIDKAERAATIYHQIQTQLKKNPRSPVLSLFVNEYHIDMHNGVTVQAAYADGTVSWQSDPFQNAGGDPEVVLAVDGWLAPAMSRSREQAIRDVWYSDKDSGVLDRADNERAIVADAWCVLLTDDSDPHYLAPLWGSGTEEDYNEQLREELGYEAKMDSGSHLLAIGEEAVARLVVRFEHELAPILRASQAGRLEASRIRANLDAALAALESHGQPVSLGPNRNIKYDTEHAFGQFLTESLSARGITTRKHFASSILDECREEGIDVNIDSATRYAFESISAEHIGNRVSSEELLGAVREIVTDMVDFRLS